MSSGYCEEAKIYRFTDVFFLPCFAQKTTYFCFYYVSAKDLIKILILVQVQLDLAMIS